MDEQACRELIKNSAEIAIMRGGEKKPAAEEKVTIDFAFATVCTIAPVKKGEVLTKDNIWVKRPGSGEIPAEKFKGLLGKQAAADIGNDVQLTWKDIAVS
jgi:N-acetylneuraminate synthase